MENASVLKTTIASALLVIVALAAACWPDELRQVASVTLPSGQEHPVYVLESSEAISDPTTVPVVVRPAEDNFAKYDGLRYPTSDRVFFALPVTEPGYYLISGGFGVYESVEAMTGQHSYSDVVAFPAKEKAYPETYIFRGEPGQSWATQILTGGEAYRHTKADYEAPTKTLHIGAVKAGSLQAGADFSANLAEKIPAALFELEAVPPQAYALSLNTEGDADYDLFLLCPASPVGVRVLQASASRVIGAQHVAEQIWFSAEAEREYLALVTLVSGAGDFELSLEQLAGAPPKAEWILIKDDDGEKDSHWGQVTSSAAALYKELVVADDPADIARAVLQFHTSVAPYDPESEKHLHRGAPADKQWDNMVISLNGEAILQRPVNEVADVGWHEVALDPALLIKGTNVVEFTLAPGGDDYFYMSIDLDTARGRSYTSFNGEIDRSTLRPNRQVGPGEYMVRLKYQVR